MQIFLKTGYDQLIPRRRLKGIDEGFDEKKKKDNCWHSFKTP